MDNLDFFEILDEFAAQPGLWLYPAIVPAPKGYVDRIMADGEVTVGEIFTEMIPPEQPEPPEPASALIITKEGMYEEIVMGSRRGGIRWDEPLIVQVCCWPYEDGSGTEVSFSLRQRGAPHTTPWLHMRTLYPSDAVRTAQLNTKQVYAPYLPPTQAQRLWTLLDTAASIHGHRPRQPFTRHPEDAELEALVSQGPRAECVACGSTAVIFVAPQAYQCYNCGHEGGEGFDDYRERQERQQYAQMPLPVRRTLTLKDLRSAYDDITSASQESDWRFPSDRDLNPKPVGFEASRTMLSRYKTFEAIGAAMNKTPEYNQLLQPLLDFKPKCIGSNRAKEMADMIKDVYDRIKADHRDH